MLFMNVPTNIEFVDNNAAIANHKQSKKIKNLVLFKKYENKKNKIFEAFSSSDFN